MSAIDSSVSWHCPGLSTAGAVEVPHRVGSSPRDIRVIGGVFRGSRWQITVMLPRELLDKVDRLWRAVEYGVSIDGPGRRNDRD